MNSEVRFYMSVFLRRFHIFAVVAASISAAAFAIAVLLPTKYVAEARLLMEAAQIPDELAASTVQTDALEQLEILEARLMTRANLLDIAREFEVFGARTDLFPDQIVDRMRDQTYFETSSGRDRATLFTIGFEAENPRTSAAVVNDYVTRVLEGNVEIRTDRAEDTQEFFQQEVDRLGQDLERQSQRILEFKEANINALPETSDYRLNRQATLQERLAQIERDISSLGQQRERLIVLFNTTGGVGGNLPDTRSREQRELADLKDELAGALSIYSPQNPRVKVLEARVAALEKIVNEQLQNAPDVEGQTANAATSVLDLQLSEIDSRVQFLLKEQGTINRELGIIELSLQATPGNAIALETLERDYTNIQNQYNAAVARLSAAATGERIELLSKGERISVISQPVVPREPASPNRPLIAFGGLGFGLLAGAALVIFMEMINKSIRRPIDLTNALGIVPLATLPMIRTHREVLRRRLTLMFILMAFAVGIPAVLYYIHLEYLPLDLIFSRALSNIGL